MSVGQRVHSTAEIRTPSRRWWSCSQCHEVVPGLVYVRWGEGLVERGPVWRCVQCRGMLQEREREVDAPIESWVWGVTVLDTKGDIRAQPLAA